MCQDKTQLLWRSALQATALPLQLEAIAHQLTCIHIHIKSWDLQSAKHKDCILPMVRQRAFRHHLKWDGRSVGGAWGSFKIPPPPGCHLCLPPTPPRPLLMKLDCCSAQQALWLLSTGALYNSLMLIVTNKSTSTPTPTPTPTHYLPTPLCPPESATSHPELMAAWNALDSCQGAQTWQSNEKAHWQAHTHTHTFILIICLINMQ